MSYSSFRGQAYTRVARSLRKSCRGRNNRTCLHVEILRLWWCPLFLRREVSCLFRWAGTTSYSIPGIHTGIIHYPQSSPSSSSPLSRFYRTKIPEILLLFFRTLLTGTVFVITVVTTNVMVAILRLPPLMPLDELCQKDRFACFPHKRMS